MPRIPPRISKPLPPTETRAASKVAASQAAPVPESKQGWLEKAQTGREALEWVGGGIAKAGELFEKNGKALRGVSVLGTVSEIACATGLLTEIPAVVSEAAETVRSVRDSVRKGEYSQAGKTAVEFGREGVRVVKCTIDNVEAAVKVGGAAAKLIKSTAVGAKLAGATASAVTRAAALPGLKAIGPALKTVASSPLGKAASRFVPALNVGMAALDTAHAYQTVRDPSASAGKKVASVITAAGSIASATNIPIVSQVGAAVSMLGYFATNIL